MTKKLCIVLLALILAAIGICPAFADSAGASEIVSQVETFLTLSGRKSTRLEKGQINFSTMDFDTEALQVDHVTPEGIQIPIKYQFFDVTVRDTTLHFTVIKAVLPDSDFGITDENMGYYLFGNDFLNRNSNLGRFYFTQDESGKWYEEMRYDLMLDPGSAAKVCFGVLTLLEKDVDRAVNDLKEIMPSGQ